ncbi:MAG: hypothetical protein J6Y08_02985 [Clostridiales bacterium]|nr:hypothetical protein [Clostridiales bacterium]
MNKKRIMALLTALVMLSGWTSGCKKKDSKKSGDKEELKKAEAVLDDFCAYLYKVKFSKIGKLLDGDSDNLDKLAGYMESDFKEIVQAASDRIEYEIEVTSADTKKEEGAATLVLTYFDTEDIEEDIEDAERISDVVEAIKDAEEMELEFDIDLVYDDDWKIDAKSADTVMDELYSFIDDVDIEPVTRTTTTTDYYNAPFSEFSTDWYDEDYNSVVGYHESDDFVMDMVVTWDYYDNETVTYEFEDENGNILYSGSYTILCCTDIIECTWRPTSKIPVGTLTCKVYDPNGDLFSTSSITIYADGVDIPVPYYVYDLNTYIENGQIVPGFHEDDEVMHFIGELDREYKSLSVPVAIYEDKTSTNVSKKQGLQYETVCEINGSNRFEFDWEHKGDIPVGDYFVVVYDCNGNADMYFYFQVIAKDDDFPHEDAADFYDSEWIDSMDNWCPISEISTKSEGAVFIVWTTDYYEYMPFTYELVDHNDKVIQSGSTALVHYNDTLYLFFEFDGLQKGSITCRVYNPDGSVLVESSLPVV